MSKQPENPVSGDDRSLIRALPVCASRAVSQRISYEALITRARGIAPEDISKVFEPYYSTKDTGTGLGLAIVKKAVDDHGGTINVKSKVGSGTTFIITLPAKGKGERLRNGTQEHTRS